jgi:branched-chain amino acid transport system ATP-binding protein
MTESVLLRVINLQVGYGSLKVIDGLSMHVEAGEVVALIGANGAGKSTLLKSIAGLIPLAGGHLLLRGKDVSRLPAEVRACRGLTLVPEGRGLFPGMSVLDNLRMGGYAQGFNRHELAGRIEQVCALFPILSERPAELARNLSGGQQQALALARALVGKPDVLLLDEPSTGLAPVLVQELFAQIRQLKALGLGIMIAEQNVGEALKSADRAYVMKTGKIVLEGPAERLMQSPDVQKAYLGR